MPTKNQRMPPITELEVDLSRKLIDDIMAAVKRFTILMRDQDSSLSTTKALSIATLVAALVRMAIAAGISRKQLLANVDNLYRTEKQD